VEITRFATFCCEFKLCSRIVANEIFRQVMTEVVYGDIEEHGAMKEGVTYNGFLHCLGVLADTKAEAAVEVQGLESKMAKARNLLEEMAVAPGVACVEKATIPLKSLQKQVKKILADGDKFREEENSAEKQMKLSDDDFAAAAETARQRIIAWNSEHHRKELSSTAAGAMGNSLAESTGTEGESRPREEVAEALESHPEVLNAALQELSARQREAAFHGQLREASELSDAIEQLKEDSDSARLLRVKREHNEAVHQMEDDSQEQLAELEATWQVYEEEQEELRQMQLAEMESRHAQQRQELEEERILCMENVPKAKPPGMSESIWAQVNDTRKLRPSKELLDIDMRYQKALTIKSFDVAEDLKLAYEQLAVVEWEQDHMREMDSLQRRAILLEQNLQQEMDVFFARTQVIQDEAQIAKDKEFDTLQAFYNKCHFI